MAPRFPFPSLFERALVPEAAAHTLDQPPSSIPPPLPIAPVVKVPKPKIPFPADVIAEEGTKQFTLEAGGDEENTEPVPDPADEGAPQDAETPPTVTPPSTAASEATGGVDGAQVRDPAAVAPPRSNPFLLPSEQMRLPALPPQPTPASSVSSVTPPSAAAHPVPYLNAQPDAVDGPTLPAPDTKQAVEAQWLQRLHTQRSETAFDQLVQPQFDQLAAASPLIAVNGRGPGNKYRTLNALNGSGAYLWSQPNTLPIAPPSLPVGPPADNGGQGGPLDQLWAAGQWFTDNALQPIAKPFQPGADVLGNVARAGVDIIKKIDNAYAASTGNSFDVGLRMLLGGKAPDVGGSPTPIGWLASAFRLQDISIPAIPGALKEFDVGSKKAVRYATESLIDVPIPGTDITPVRAFNTFATDQLRTLSKMRSDDWLKSGLEASANFFAELDGLRAQTERLAPIEVTPDELARMSDTEKAALAHDQMARQKEREALQAQGVTIGDPGTKWEKIGFVGEFMALNYLTFRYLSELGFTAREVPAAAGPWTWAKWGPASSNVVRSMGVNALGTYTFMNEHEARYSNWIQSTPYANAFNAMLMEDPNDPAWKGRGKLGIEGALFGLLEVGLYLGSSFKGQIRANALQMAQHGIDPRTVNMPGRLLGDPTPEAQYLLRSGTPEHAAMATDARAKLTDPEGVDVSMKYLKPPGEEPPPGGGGEGGGAPPPAAPPAAPAVPEAAPAAAGPATGQAMDRASALAIPDETLVEAKGYTRIGDTGVSANYAKVDSAADLQRIVDETAAATRPAAAGPVDAAIASAQGPLIGLTDEVQNIQAALAAGRRDVAEAIVQKYERAAAAYDTAPQIPTSDVRYRETSHNLVHAQAELADQAAALRVALGKEEPATAGQYFTPQSAPPETAAQALGVKNVPPAVMAEIADRATLGRQAAVRDPRTGQIHSGDIHAVGVRQIAKEWGWPEDQVWRRLWQKADENFGFIDESGNFVPGGQVKAGEKVAAPSAAAAPAPRIVGEETPPRTAAVYDPQTGKVGLGPSHEEAIRALIADVGGGEVSDASIAAMTKRLEAGQGTNQNFGFFENGRFRSMAEAYPTRVVPLKSNEFFDRLAAQRKLEAYRPVVRDPETGMLFYGKSIHSEAVDKLARARGVPSEQVAASLPEDAYGLVFRDEPGKFYTQPEANQRIIQAASGNKVRQQLGAGGEYVYDPEAAIIHQMDAPAGARPAESLATSDEAWQALVARRGVGPHDINIAPLTPEEETAYRTVLDATGAKLQKLAGMVLRPEGATPENLFEFRKMHAEYAALEQVILGHPERADALLAEFKLTPNASPVDQAAEAANIIMRNGGIDMNRDLAAKVAHAAADKLPTFVEQTAGQKTRGVISQLWFALQLAPRIAGRAATEVSTTAVHMMDAQFAAFWGKALGTPGAAISDAMTELGGYFTGLADSLVAAKQAFKTGWPGWGVRDVESFGRSALDPNTLGATPNQWFYRPLQWLDATIRAPGRTSSFIQEFFQHEVYIGTVKRAAAQQARSELQQGLLTGDQVGARVSHLVEAALNGDAIAAGLRTQARQVATLVGLSGQPGRIAQTLLSIRNMDGLPPMVSWVGRYLVPFANRPLNALKYAYEHTPLAFLSSEFRSKLAAGGASRDLALGQITTGTVLMGLGAELAMQGTVVGAKPEEPGAAEIWSRSHKNPYTLKVGDYEVPLAVLGPVGELFKYGVMMKEYFLNSNGDQKVDTLFDQAFEATVLSAANTMMEPTMARDLADALAAVRDPTGAEAKRWLDRQLAKPIPSILTGGAKLLTPEERYIDGLWDEVASRIPGLRAGVAPIPDRWGRPLSYAPDTSPYVDAFFGVYGYHPTTQPIDQVMLKEHWYLGMPERTWTVRGQQGIKASPGAYFEFMDAQGQQTPTQIAAMLKRPGALTSTEYATFRGKTDYLVQRYGNHTLLDTLNLIVGDKHPLSVTYKQLATPDAREKFVRRIASDYADAAKLAVIGRHPEMVQQAQTQMVGDTSKKPSPAPIIRSPAAPGPQPIQPR